MPDRPADLSAQRRLPDRRAWPEVVCEIERVMAREVGRGSALLLEYTAGGLARAAKSLLGQSPAGQSSVGHSSVGQSPAGRRPCHVVVLTGFYVPRARRPAAETDGPVGAVQVAAALVALGARVRILTDQPCEPVVRAAIEAAGVPVPLDTAPLPATVGDAGFAEWERAARDRYRSVTHMLAIERAGPSGSGPPRNMRGEDLSGCTAPLDRIYAGGDWYRIGIGDWGNELGMGALPPQLPATPPLPDPAVRCVVGCAALLVGGTSNWAAAGLVAALASYPGAASHRDRLAPLLHPEWSRAVLAATVERGGAVDGVLRRPVATVDGLAWPEYAAPLEDLRCLVDTSACGP